MGSPGTTAADTDTDADADDEGEEDSDSGAGTGGRGQRARRATTHDASGTTKRRRGGKKWKYVWRSDKPTIDRNGRDVEIAWIKIIFKEQESSIPSDLEALKDKANRLVINPEGIGRRGRRFNVKPDDNNADEYYRIVIDNHSGFTLDETD